MFITMNTLIILLIYLFSKYQKNTNVNNDKYFYNDMKVGITINSIKTDILNYYWMKNIVIIILLMIIKRN